MRTHFLQKEKIGCASLGKTAFFKTASLTVVHYSIYYLMESQLACTLSATFFAEAPLT
jgi:hypothetical protein